MKCWPDDPGRDEAAVTGAIRAALKETGWSQARLARELGVTPAHLNMVLSGRRTSHMLLDDAAFTLELISDTDYVTAYDQVPMPPQEV